MKSIIARIDAEIEELESRKRQIQSECVHPRSSTERQHKVGGENDNHYWTDLRCGLCDKRWIAEGSV